MKYAEPSLEALLKLLTDEDDIARVAMVKLLSQYGPESEEILLQLQECDNPVLRKRSHQMQVLLTVKQRRFELFSILQRRNGNFMLGDVLQTMHLIWFDQDSSVELAKTYANFIRTYPILETDSLKTLANFMKKHKAVTLKVGLVDNEVTTSDKLQELATIPSREGLLTMLAGGLMGTVRDLSICLDLYGEQLEEK